ncbi:UDP-3-O-(3-hydroxymyristoyl)glucosamine N-acyltransferase [Marinomonas transparens]|uniref:UDP-3-O-acylglucosamine N-acyltransferase n=1 Tax=Marinomonas transparens TaxID=2795388 RepID=A0A934MWP8_9GAMM|nr:UDP-3-O-(3-hydroxymyristoyl)glucosamine N-acyltransferase [Marinomonas transparens]MBJ7538404.1 UDP-3-O-(3-hydroxymyristoyl)glucosamine N-acyltransferase [Marinomonas transparens]
MSYTLAELADKVQGTVKGNAELMIDGIGTLEKADVHALSFLANPKYQNQLESTSAGAVIVKNDELAQLVDNAIVVSNPYLAFAQLSHLFVPLTESWSGVHQSAVISSNAQLGDDVLVGPNVVIDDDVVIAEGCVIGAGCVIGRGAQIAQGSRLYANVTLYHDVIIGEKCIFHSGVVIGADGFGFAPASYGWEKIDQLGSVVIGNNVEVGANTTIDRGAIENTCIGHGVKIDNQVQIAHNVVIGDNTAIAACTAIAGSVSIGSACTISGGVGIAGHIEIVDHVHVTAMSMISKSILRAGSYSSGSGMESTSKWRRSVARIRQLDNMAKKISKLEKILNKFSEKG